MQTSLIIGAGPGAYWDGRYAPDLIICADGGLDTARRLGLRPHVYIGDGDSVCSEPDPGMTILRHPAEKDHTDLQACVEYVIGRNIPDVAITGATGGRLDHFLANVGLLETLASHGIRGVILDAQNEIRVLGNLCVFAPPHAYRYFSVLPLDGRVDGVTIEGARYPLDNAVIRRGAAAGLSVSNEPIEGQTVRITAKSGQALVVRATDN